MKLFIFCLLLLQPILGHNWLESPTSRNGGVAFSGTTCDGSTKTTPLSVTAGSAITATCHLVASANEASLATETDAQAIASFPNAKTGGTDTAPTQTGSVTIPKDTAPGSYVLQYEWSGYVNCVDLAVEAAESDVSSPDSNSNGSSDSSVSAGQGFSIALIVIAIVVVAVIILAAVIYKLKNPASFAQLKQDLLNKP